MIKYIQTILILNLLCSGCLSPQERDRRQLERWQARAETVASLSVDDRTKNAILNGKIFIGMSALCVSLSLDIPYNFPDTRINRTVFSDYVHEQWCLYPTPPYGPEYLYFENDVLTSWQE